MFSEAVTERSKRYAGENLRAVAMPLGGIGTGTVALCGDGSLRQWQVNNSVNHLAFVPHSFFAVRAQQDGQAAVARVLQSSELYAEEFAPIPCANDYVIPDECRRLLATLPGIQATEFVGEYPIAEIAYRDDALPITVNLTAYSPFCPLDSANSGLPAVVFQFTAHNPAAHAASVQFAATLQNFTGWDGVQEIRGTACPLYGGNENQTLRLRGLSAVTMQNTHLPANHPKNGSLCLAALHPDAHVRPIWTDLNEFWADFARDGVFVQSRVAGPSAQGETVNGAVAVGLRLEPGESKTVTFLLCWHFPNRYVDWVQWFSGIEDPKSLLWLGNAYNTRFASAAAVAEYVRDNFERLDATTRRFRQTFFDSTLPMELLDTVSAQMSIVRSPTCLWTEDGRFHAFEGCNGASTGGWNGTGGCCPMNCTHVFAYEMSLAALFPDLERTMRETELFHQLHAEGYLPHRVTLPLYLRRPWARTLGGPDTPALDGLLSMVLKTYREHLRSADPTWLERAWPKVKQALERVMTVHDTDGDGVLKGEQPNTYDISIYGPNTFIGTLYLAALRAGEEMAKRFGETEQAAAYRQRFEQGRSGYDTLLWNGDNYIQVYDAEKNPEQNWGQGCHSDQLFGQWWASLLGLGDLLPPDHVRTAVGSIVRYNFRQNFVGHVQKPRVFASDDEAGLLVCSWPAGGRPEVPTLYSDEIWTGLEYEVAALCLFTGHIEQALEMLRATRHRYNGTRRSPWNDIECGDHYARALSSWGLLDAACGYHYDAASAALTIAPRLTPDNFRAFFLTATAWGSVSLQTQDGVTTLSLHADWGSLELNTLTLPEVSATTAQATIGETLLPVESVVEERHLHLRFAETIRIPAGATLRVRLSAGIV